MLEFKRNRKEPASTMAMTQRILKPREQLVHLGQDELAVNEALEVLDSLIRVHFTSGRLVITEWTPYAITGCFVGAIVTDFKTHATALSREGPLQV